MDVKLEFEQSLKLWRDLSDKVRRTCNIIWLSYLDLCIPLLDSVYVVQLNSYGLPFSPTPCQYLSVSHSSTTTYSEFLNGVHTGIHTVVMVVSEYITTR